MGSPLRVPQSTLPSVSYVSLLVGNEPVTLSTREGTSDQAVIDEVFRDDTYGWPTNILRGVDVLDLGANIGAFALRCAAAGVGRVRCVEPEPGNLLQLQRNLALNPNLAPKIQVIAAAAGPAGKAYVDLRPEWPAGAWTGPAPDSGGVQVESKPLAELLDGLTSDVFLKIDIEGGEFALIDDAPAWCWVNVHSLVMEVHAGTLGDRPWVEPAGAVGRLLETLAESFRIHTLGKPSHGMMLWAERL